jgi:uncharacterized tellurite resistance protein B-like protein
MFDKIRRLFQADPNSDPAARSAADVQLATAALLIEMIRADGVIDDAEITTVSALLQDQFALTPEDARTLMKEAEHTVDASVEFHAFASAINTHFSADEKAHMIECMWRVAYADGVKDKLEEHLIRRVADILYVPHHEFIRARRLVESERKPKQESDDG